MRHAWLLGCLLLTACPGLVSELPGDGEVVGPVLVNDPRAFFNA